MQWLRSQIPEDLDVPSALPACLRRCGLAPAHSDLSGRTTALIQEYLYAVARLGIFNLAREKSERNGVAYRVPGWFPLMFLGTSDSPDAEEELDAPLGLREAPDEVTLDAPLG